MKKLFSILLRIGISIILLIFLFRQVDKKALFDVLKNVNPLFLFLAFVIYSLVYILCLLRWEMLLKAVEIRLPLKRVLISYAGSIFFNLFLPSTIGGDLVRSIDLAAHTKQPKEVIATVFLDRLSGFVGLVILALFSLVFGWKLLKDRSVVVSVLIIVGILAAILLVLFNKFIYSRINRLLHSPNAGKIRELITNLHHEIHIFRHHKKVIVNNLIFSVVIQSVPVFTFFVIALSLGIKIPLLYFFIFIPIIGAITMLPISIGGLGLREATTIYFFAKVGLSKPSAFAISLLNFSFIIAYGALGGLIYVLTIHHRRIQHRPPSAA